MQLGIRPRFLYIPMTHQGSLLPDKNARHYLMDRYEISLYIFECKSIIQFLFYCDET